MKLSVIIPVFNCGKFIFKCLESLATQTYKNIEIIVIDDGSTDDSLNVCANFDKASIKIVHQENLGVSAARNRGIKESTGDYITFIDADDWLEPTTYERMMDGFVNSSDVDVVVGGFVRQDGNRVIEVLQRREKMLLSNEEAMQELLLSRYFRGEVCDKIYRRTLLNGNVLNQDIAVAEDWLMNFRVFYNAQKVLYCPVFGYHYVVNTGSVTQIFTRKNLTQITAIKLMKEMTGISKKTKRILQGVYGRSLASNILRMLLSGDASFFVDIKNFQYMLRKSFVSIISAPGLSFRQRLGIVYAIMPYDICKVLSKAAKIGQKNI